MLCSTFAGLLVFAIPQAGQALSPSLEADGDRFIGQDFENATWLFQGTQNINGNLTIRAGGTVIVTDGVMNFLSTQTRVHMLIIEDGGQLILRNSVLKAEDVLSDVYFALGVLVRNGGSLVAEDSLLSFNGKILVDDATFIATGSTIDGPLFTAMSSDVELYDSAMTNVPGTPTLVEMSYPYSFATSYNHTLNVDYTFQRNPDAARAVVPAGQVAADLTMSDANYVALANGQSMAVRGFDIGGLVFDEGQALSVILKAEYRTADNFVETGSNNFYYFEYLDTTPDIAGNMPITKTYLDYDPAGTNQDRIVSQDLTGLALSALDLSVLNVTLTNTRAQNVFIDRVWVEVGLAIPAYNNVTIAGSSELTAVNSMLGVNYFNYTMPEFRKLVVTDMAQANLYGVHVDGEFEDQNSTAPFVTVEKSLTFKPLGKGVGDTTTEPISDLLNNDGTYYTLPGLGTISVSSFNTGNLNGKISSALLTIRYSGTVGYTSTALVQWNITGNPIANTNIAIDSTSIETVSYDLMTSGDIDLDQFSLVNVRFANPDTSGVQFDSMWIVSSFDPTINVYRWADVWVVDSNNEPVSGAYANATGSLTNQPAMYNYNNAWSQVPSQNILDYLGKSSSDFMMTNELGLVELPLLTDVVSAASTTSENYMVSISYTSPRGVQYTPTAPYTAFDAYPDLLIQSSDIQVMIKDLKQEGSGDWLVTTTQSVATPTMTWQHNIIVEGNGHLTIDGTNVFMDQTANPNTIQIIIRDNGTLVLNNSTVDSDSLVRINLFDNGRLFVNGSILRSNVGLIMDGSSTIFMENSRVRGSMSAPVTSSVTLETFNTTFDYPLADFGGNSVARLTASNINGVSPVSPKDNAVIYLYGWIVVQVFDGTGAHPLAGVNVETKKFPSTLYATGITGENGILLVQGLSAIVTKTGPELSGVYQLNATYWYLGANYESDNSGIAQVQYDLTKPMVRSDSYVRLDISSAKPDIDPPFTASTNQTYRGSPVTLSTVINNIGVVTAYDILVRFEDNSTLGKTIIQDYVIEELAPMSNVTVSIVWTTEYPLGLHNVSVTVDPLNEIPELNEDNNYNQTSVTVLGVPDPTILAGDIILNPEEPARNRTAFITAAITNLGDFTASAFNVSFFDSIEGRIGNDTINNIPTGQKGMASISWVPSVPGVRTISVIVDEDAVLIEGNENNNMASIQVDVNDYPDLVGVGVSFLINDIAGDRANVDDDITIVATVFNSGESEAINFNVVFWLNGETVISSVNVPRLAAGSSTSVMLPWSPDINVGLGQYQNVTIVAVVNPGTNLTYNHVPEMDDPLNDNNQADQDLLIIDNRPDLAIIDPMITSVGAQVTRGVLGEVVNIAFDARNIGIVDSSNVRVKIYLDTADDIVIYDEVMSIAKGASKPINVTWLINVQSGTYSLVMDVNAGSDANSTNNRVVVSFVVAIPAPSITIDLGGKTSYAPGDAILVNGRVQQSTNDAPLIDQLVRVSLTDQSGFTLSTVFNVTTDDAGYFFVYIQTPADIEGSQLVSATLVTSEGSFTQNANIDIEAPLTPETIPFWVYLLIIAIVIVVIVIFSMYLYKVGLGRMVECGNCGALIPEASKHCPKCGVEFESGTAKCSECGAWIPSKAESCPDCGAKFMTEPVEQGQGTGYIEAMRKRYEEYVDGFRTQAKAALGNKYSEEKFLEWLQTEPNYLPFEEWLRKEEMSKRTGIFPCPSCGTLNPRESTVCHRCGTVFEQKAPEPEPAKPEEKKSPFRRIVRRSEDGKGKEPVQPQPAPEEPPMDVKEEGENKIE